MPMALSLGGPRTRRGLVFDPRTKLLLLFTISIVVLGGLGGSSMSGMQVALSAMPFVMLLSSSRFAAAGVYAIAYLAAVFVEATFIERGTGPVLFLLLLMCGIFARLLPGFVAAYYLVTTTTVSEFVASMHRLRVPDLIVIPLSVMFRFIPTVIEEARSVQQVMRMRGIGLRGGSPITMLEYRVVPVLMCSARIGEELSAAALTRGLGSPIARTNVCEVGLKFHDWAVIVLCVSAYVAATVVMIRG